MNSLNNNPEINTLFSRFEVLELIQNNKELQEITKNKFNGDDPKCLIYLDHEVRFGSSTTILNDIDIELIQQMRIFTDHAELFAWRSSKNTLQGRLRIDDSSGKKTTVLDSSQKLQGHYNGFQLIEPNRGFKLKIEGLEFSSNMLFLGIRNYIKKGKNGKACIIDTRITSIQEGEVK